VDVAAGDAEGGVVAADGHPPHRLRLIDGDVGDDFVGEQRSGVRHVDGLALVLAAESDRVGIDPGVGLVS